LKKTGQLLKNRESRVIWLAIKYEIFFKGIEIERCIDVAINFLAFFHTQNTYKHQATLKVKVNQGDN